MKQNGRVTVTETLRIQYQLSDNQMTYNFDIDDYDQTLTDDQLWDGAMAILAENVFAPFGLSMIGIVDIQKIQVTKEIIDEYE